jgi:hypothetical protein
MTIVLSMLGIGAVMGFCAGAWDFTRKRLMRWVDPDGYEAGEYNGCGCDGCEDAAWLDDPWQQEVPDLDVAGYVGRHRKELTAAGWVDSPREWPSRYADLQAEAHRELRDLARHPVRVSAG